MRGIVAALLLFVACAHAISFIDLVLEEWDLFKIQHKKKYESDTEEKFRMKIFMDNRHKIAKHNSKFERGDIHFKLGLNKYADMLHHEFIGTLNGFNKTRKVRLLGSNSYQEVVVPNFVGATFIAPANVALPSAVNWAEHGAVTPVKDQGACGSCWSFSATGSLEGQHYRKTGKLVSLSEQNLIDCSSKYGNAGCNGGLMDQAFQYVRDNKGIDTEATYKYEAEDDKCRYRAKDSGATDVGYVDLPSGDEQSLMAAVATIGPVSIAIDASHESFQFYKDGVYDEPECKNGADQLDHGVLVVGYGTDEESGKDFWLVKNSWGTTWGLNGYIKMVRNSDNQCGVATQASYPLV